MEIEFDEAKSRRNSQARGLSFDDVIRFEFAEALVIQDERKEYGETRWRALGLLDERLCALVFTLRAPKLRVISLRRANEREVKAYEAEKPET